MIVTKTTYKDGSVDYRAEVEGVSVHTSKNVPIVKEEVLGDMSQEAYLRLLQLPQDIITDGPLSVAQ